MPTYIYVGKTAREYPFPPIRRRLTPNEEVDFERDEDVPDDGRFKPAAPPSAQSTAQSATKSAAKRAKATTAAKASEVKE